jgi:hypothetical protein
VDSGASHHMMGTHELFTRRSKTHSELHVELGTHAKCGVEAVGIVGFQLELGGFLEVADVLYVPELRRNMLSVLALEDMGYAVLFQNRQVFMHSKGASSNTTMSIGVRESKVYKLQDKPVGGSKGILDHGSMSITKDEE